MNVIRLALGWLVGIALAGNVSLPLHWLAIVAGVAIAGIVVDRSRWFAPVMLCVALGGIRYHLAQPLLGPHHIERWAGTAEVTIVGRVDEEPRRDDTGQQLVVIVSHAGSSDRFAPAEGRVLVRAPPYPPYYPGDHLLLSGRLSLPRAAQRPGEFDYRAYLARRGIFVLLNRPTAIRVLATREPAWGLAQISQSREYCRRVLLRLLPEPQAALAIGILLGIQAGLPETARAAFATTGTSHILVVSGWNFTIVAAALAALAKLTRLRPWPAFWLSLAAMWIYAGFTGASAAVVRAAMMASLALLARTAERQSEPWRLLLAACWLLTLVNPHTLWDLGFQLSALATASLFAFGKPVERWLNGFGWLAHPALAAVREALTATLAAQVLTLPLMLYHFGNLSLVAPLANILIVPVVPVAMLLGMVALIGGLIWLPLGQWLAAVAWLPLSWITNVAMVLAQPAWAAIAVPAFPLWLLLASYAVIASYWLWRRPDRTETQEA
ncbi:ComEC/Rec2 family competence protein [Chloroflexus sp.]|uniref:ComEC/Rec2 family competence protein n=1 Tax=Chloroflexus sp. TaxID=1904827 RepID=UPI00298EFB75|nr:ComEC/Rec2 family competence protein [Chloroflexus sp.]MDW8402958.1 ComEC/Rec2 family competence protein [Chloroflexus sp.]